VTAPHIATQLTNYILVLGTHATFLFSPSTGQTLSRNEVAPAGVLAAATALVPTRMRIWSAGGFDTTADGTPCYAWDVRTLDPRLYSADPQYASATDYQGGIATKAQDPQFTTQTQNDGAAVYLPALDRVFLFGGFVAQNPVNGTNCLALGTVGAWEETPAPGQYSPTISSISPAYQDEDEWTTRPAPTGASTIPRETPGVYGVRFSGAGFRGSCLALVDPRQSGAIAEAVHGRYPQRHPEIADAYSVHLCHPADGSGLLSHP